MSEGPLGIDGERLSNILSESGPTYKWYSAAYITFTRRLLVSMRLPRIRTATGKASGMSDCKTSPTSMDAGFPNVAMPSDESYQADSSIIGSLMYAMTMTRPDLGFALSVLSRYCSHQLLRQPSRIQSSSQLSISM